MFRRTSHPWFGVETDSGLPADSRVDLVEKAAWSSAEKFRVLEASAAGESLPSEIWHRMWHGEVSALGVVLDNQHSSAGRQIPAKASNDSFLVFLEMQRVRHDNSVEQRKLERASEVRRLISHADLREPDEHCPCVLLQCARVPIDRVNLTSGSQEISERKGERTPASPQVGPDGARASDSRAEEI